MKLALLKGATSQTINVFIQDSASTTGSGKTGLAYNTASLTAYYVRPRATSTAITLATQTVTGAYSSGGFVELDSTNMPGWYRLDVPDAALATGVDHVGVHLRGASGMASLPLEIQLTNFDLNSASVLLSNGTGTGQVKLSGGYVAPNWGDVGNPTTTLALSGTTVKTATDIATLVSALLGAVADAAATGDPGSTALIPLAKQLVNILIGSDGVATYPAAAAPGNAVSLAEVLRSVYTQLGVAGAGLTALGDTRLANLDATVSSRLASAGYTAPPAAATNASAVRTELTTELALIDAATSSRATPAQVNSEVDAALVDIHLDHLLATTYDPASKPGAADALLNELVESDAGVARYTANALEQAPTGGSAPTVEQIADGVWDEATAGHTTSGTFGEQVKTDIDAILVDTGTTLDARIPATLVGGRMVVNVKAINDVPVTGTGVLGDEWDS